VYNPAQQIDFLAATCSCCFRCLRRSDHNEKFAHSPCPLEKFAHSPCPLDICRASSRPSRCIIRRTGLIPLLPHVFACFRCARMAGWLTTDRQEHHVCPYVVPALRRRRPLSVISPLRTISQLPSQIQLPIHAVSQITVYPSFCWPNDIRLYVFLFSRGYRGFWSHC